MEHSRGIMDATAHLISKDVALQADRKAGALQRTSETVGLHLTYVSARTACVGPPQPPVPPPLELPRDLTCQSGCR